jgi:GNAT superfamily N-acetyltransferase
MSEEIKKIHTHKTKTVSYSLRTATAGDVQFLFEVSTRAMEFVDRALNPGKEFDREEAFKKYQEKFVPEKIQIISWENEDVGRLRIVRSDSHTYVGGIQLLPEFQGKGIGTALFAELIRESETEGLPIALEVHDVNEDALRFYTRLGFLKVGHEGNKTLMEYQPKTN